MHRPWIEEKVHFFQPQLTWRFPCTAPDQGQQEILELLEGSLWLFQSDSDWLKTKKAANDRDAKQACLRSKLNPEANTKFWKVSQMSMSLIDSATNSNGCEVLLSESLMRWPYHARARPPGTYNTTIAEFFWFEFVRG